MLPGRAPGLVALLDDHERERMSRLRRPLDAGRYLAAHALARIILAEFLGGAPETIVFDRTCRCGQQHGKPALIGTGPDFSLTHSGRVVGVAVYGGGSVGLDVEHPRGLVDLPAMARHVASPTELARGDLATPLGFLSAWTAKEALLKATGLGLAGAMEAITLGPHGVEGWTGVDAPGEPPWLRRLTAPDGSPGAVAGLGTPPTQVCERDETERLRRRAPC